MQEPIAIRKALNALPSETLVKLRNYGFFEGVPDSVVVELALNEMFAKIPADRLAAQIKADSERRRSPGR